MTRLLLDEMVSPAVAEQLRAAGADVVCVAERRDLRGADDASILQSCRNDSRVLVTDNISDFRRLEAEWLGRGELHGGIVFVSTKSFPYSRHRVGLLAAALLARHSSGVWPAPGHSHFLR